MSIRTGRFFLRTFCCIITPISGILDHLWKIKKKLGKNKNKLRTIHHKTHENFKKKSVLIKKSLVHMHPMQNEIEKSYRNQGGRFQET